MPSTRTRRIAKWTGLVVCVLLGAGWFLSLFQGGGYIGATKTLSVSRGAAALLVYTPDPGDYVGWVHYRLRVVDPQWWPSYDDSTSPPSARYPQQRVRRVVVPLWIPLLLTAIPTVILWRRDRRHPPGHCRRCGYNLTGNTSGVCPECGTKVETP